ncbi:FxLD family lanthipeptide [Micromonospora sp. WMMA1363]|uniref:FxLD family lanthipeptide n=1 Tax=Micromonospora sp. WMMA1363 TaxID=3053985 RepID=UPI00259CDB38|nr:FxLD family lanthipeptide [Micromonospora sp. WMMA1363]MDM4723299.1 FxLD family lanthipeptide [Micromonospora sp. WMMA1363]MDM4723393.1 FxLD family lanthipeptide [Micromonospora sp. WMMA1363]
MPIRAADTPAPPVSVTADAAPAGTAPQDWDLDVTFVEAGDSVDNLIYMTNDGCGSTCQSACSTTCP